MRKRRTSTLSAVLGALLVLAAALYSMLQSSPATAPEKPVPPSAAAPSPYKPVPPLGGSNVEGVPWLAVYFTDPDPSGTMDENSANYVPRYVLYALDNAKQSIEVTSFDFNLPAVTDALISAKKRGVTVHIVLDEKEGSQDLKASDTESGQAFDALKALQDAGITVVNGGRSTGLMHDKIIIVDGATLFMGSWNMSYNDTFRNDNNLLQITNPVLIANYQAKFNELFVNKRFGKKATVKAQTPSLNIGGIQVENYFSPPDKVMDKLIAAVKAAQKSVKFMAFTYTDKDLANAMIQQAGAGVKVQGVIENRGASLGAFVPLFCAGLPVRTDGNKYTMHHKVIILDDATVITGSFNFTVSADEDNDDNVLIIHSPAVAALYDLEFSRVYGMGETPAASEVDCSSK
jgi:phosphatidylserine/phosphatidylglycerophosphate/cardiolipin synthase-like enzyme